VDGEPYREFQPEGSFDRVRVSIRFGNRYHYNNRNKPMNNPLNHPSYFLGIDIGKETFTASLHHVASNTHQVFSGPMKTASRRILKWLHQQHVDATPMPMALEATGVYGERLCYELFAAGCTLYVLHPTDVRRSMKHPERKSDSDDSKQIAELIAERWRKLIVWSPNLEVVDRIKTLLAERRQIVKMTVQTKNALHAARFKRHRVRELEARDQARLDFLKTQRMAVEQQIEALFESDPQVKEAAAVLRSTPTVGRMLTACLIVVTNAGLRTTDSRKIASLAGIAPQPYESGNMKLNRRSSGHGDPEFRRILHMAARSGANHYEQYRAYRRKKLEEKKPALLIYNNISNRILHVACAVLASKQPFDPNFSTHRRGG